MRYLSFEFATGREGVVNGYESNKESGRFGRKRPATGDSWVVVVDGEAWGDGRGITVVVSLKIR